MSPDLKPHFVVDECIGKPLTSALAGLLRLHSSIPEFEHVLDKQLSGVADDDWIPKLDPNSTVIISADRGTRYGGPKLPRVASACGIRYILISGRMHNAKQFEKARAIVYLFPRILDEILTSSHLGWIMRYSSSHNPTIVRRSR